MVFALYYISSSRKRSDGISLYGVTDSNDNKEEFYTLAELVEFWNNRIPITGLGYNSGRFLITVYKHLYGLTGNINFSGTEKYITIHYVEEDNIIVRENSWSRYVTGGSLYFSANNQLKGEVTLFEQNVNSQIPITLEADKNVRKISLNTNHLIYKSIKCYGSLTVSSALFHNSFISARTLELRYGLYVTGSCTAECDNLNLSSLDFNSQMVGNGSLYVKVKKGIKFTARSLDSIKSYIGAGVLVIDIIGGNEKLETLLIGNGVPYLVDGEKPVTKDCLRKQTVRDKLSGVSSYDTLLSKAIDAFRETNYIEEPCITGLNYKIEPRELKIYGLADRDRCSCISKGYNLMISLLDRVLDTDTTLFVGEFLDMVESDMSVKIQTESICHSAGVYFELLTLGYVGKSELDYYLLVRNGNYLINIYNCSQLFIMCAEPYKDIKGLCSILGRVNGISSLGKSTKVYRIDQNITESLTDLSEDYTKMFFNILLSTSLSIWGYGKILVPTLEGDVYAFKCSTPEKVNSSKISGLKAPCSDDIVYLGSGEQYISELKVWNSKNASRFITEHIIEENSSKDADCCVKKVSRSVLYENIDMIGVLFSETEQTHYTEYYGQDLLTFVESCGYFNQVTEATYKRLKNIGDKTDVKYTQSVITEDNMAFEFSSCSVDYGVSATAGKLPMVYSKLKVTDDYTGDIMYFTSMFSVQTWLNLIYVAKGDLESDLQLGLTSSGNMYRNEGIIICKTYDYYTSSRVKGQNKVIVSLEARLNSNGIIYLVVKHYMKHLTPSYVVVGRFIDDVAMRDLFLTVKEEEANHNSMPLLNCLCAGTGRFFIDTVRMFTKANVNDIDSCKSMLGKQYKMICRWLGSM